ncbi:MAG TPA: DUF4112 domain-containing protein, partial [Pyrinomonadaceae bacterium]|nr:DUF4112 domain-containing protein [Pyrinomonadaceae bacterium]
LDSRDPFGNRKLAIGNRAVLRPTQVQIERELEVFSQLMDNQFRIPVLGWRFGLNAIIDLIPEFGDVITTLIALYVLVSAVRYRVPKVTLLRMGLNIAIYFVVGLIPLAGDLFAVWWKPNIRNINLLRQRATVTAAEAKQGRASDWLFVALIAGGLLALLFGSIALTLFVLWYIASHLQFGV